MAYVSKETKAIIANNIKPILKKYGLKATLRVDHSTKIILTIRSGKLDLMGNYVDRWGYNRPYFGVNTYNIKGDFTDKNIVECFEQLHKAILSAGYFDHSDIMTDYVNVAYYYEIKVGEYNKPYILTQ